MGFKDLNLLNIALLAKQCWMMVLNPKAWQMRIMKGTYFFRCAIMDAKKGGKGIVGLGKYNEREGVFEGEGYVVSHEWGRSKHMER